MRVLRRGFGVALRVGRRTTIHPDADGVWRQVVRAVQPLADAHRRAGGSWDTAAAAAIARLSVDDVIPAGGRPRSARSAVEALRGLYLAEPAGLSALVLVDQVLGGEPPGRLTACRIQGGNDRLIDALAERLRGRLATRHVVLDVRQDADRVRVVVEDGSRRRHELAADYAVVTLPPALLLACRFDPPLPPQQRRALSRIALGAATKVSLRSEIEGLAGVHRAACR